MVDRAAIADLVDVEDVLAIYLRNLPDGVASPMTGRSMASERHSSSALARDVRIDMMSLHR